MKKSSLRLIQAILVLAMLVSTIMPLAVYAEELQDNNPVVDGFVACAVAPKDLAMDATEMPLADGQKPGTLKLENDCGSCIITNQSWFSEDDPNLETFKDGKTYYFNIALKAADNFYFDKTQYEDYAANLFKCVDMEEVSGRVADDQKTMEVQGKYTCDKTSIGSIILDGKEIEPKLKEAGKLPTINSEDYDVQMEWYRTASAKGFEYFEPSDSYELEMKFTAKNGKHFSQNLKIVLKDVEWFDTFSWVDAEGSMAEAVFTYITKDERTIKELKVDDTTVLNNSTLMNDYKALGEIDFTWSGLPGTIVFTDGSEKRVANMQQLIYNGTIHYGTIRTQEIPQEVDTSNIDYATLSFYDDPMEAIAKAEEEAKPDPIYEKIEEVGKTYKLTLAFEEENFNYSTDFNATLQNGFDLLKLATKDMEIKLDKAPTYLSIKDGMHLSIAEQKWTEDLEGTTPIEGNLVAEQNYYYTLTLKAEDGYLFELPGCMDYNTRKNNVFDNPNLFDCLMKDEVSQDRQYWTLCYNIRFELPPETNLYNHIMNSAPKTEEAKQETTNKEQKQESTDKQQSEVTVAKDAKDAKETSEVAKKVVDTADHSYIFKWSFVFVLSGVAFVAVTWYDKARCREI